MNYSLIVFSIIVLINDSMSQRLTTTIRQSARPRTDEPLLPLIWTETCDEKICKGAWARGVPVCLNGGQVQTYDYGNGDVRAWCKCADTTGQDFYYWGSQCQNKALNSATWWPGAGSSSTAAAKRN